MKNEKIIDRVKKLLAMAGDTSSPNEAAIAARRARVLIDQYQISEMDLNTVDASDMGAADFDTGQKQTNGPLSTMAVSVAKYNDCIVSYSRIGGRLALRFKGMLVDSVCAVEMFKYLRDAMYNQAEQRASGRADRYAYRLGFAAGVGKQIADYIKEREALKTSDGRSLVICKAALVKKEFGAARYSQKGSSYSGNREAFGSGYRSGQKTNLSRQVSGGARRRLETAG